MADILLSNVSYDDYQRNWKKLLDSYNENFRILEYFLRHLPSTDISIVDIEIAGEKDLKYVGETYQLLVSVSPTDAALTYASSDDSVFTVSETGLITATGVGSATVTVTGTKDDYTTDVATMVVTVALWDYYEYGSADWNAGGVIFTLVNGYTVRPEGVGYSEDGNGCSLAYTQETVGGVADCYSKVAVTPLVTSPAPAAGTKIIFQGICSGMVERT